MNSIPFAGQAVGALFSEAVADYLGYKMGLIVVSIIQLFAIVSEYLLFFSLPCKDELTILQYR